MDRNPFVYGRELGREELADRDDELERIASTIANRDRLFLIGPRRYGKTSVLAAAAVAASDEGVVVLRVDAEKYESLDLLARAVLTAAARALRDPVDRVARLVGRVAASLRPQISVDPASGQVGVGLGVASTEAGAMTMLSDALDAVNALARESGRELAVILDEVQQVVIDGGLDAERQLRAAAQQHQHISYVLSGSDTRMLTAMTENPNRPFYRQGARLFLGGVPEAEFRRYLETRFARTGMDTAEGACDTVLSLAEGVPYSVQRLAHEAWEMLRGTQRPVLTSQHVAQALDGIVAREDPFYSQLWIALTRNQKKALKAVSERDGEDLLAAATSRQYDIPASSMQAAVKSLCDRQLVRPDQNTGKSRFRLVDPFVRAWLRQAQPM